VLHLGDILLRRLNLHKHSIDCRLGVRVWGAGGVGYITVAILHSYEIIMIACLLLVNN